MEVNGVSRSLPPIAAVTVSKPSEHMAENREIIQAVKALNSAEKMGQDNELTFQMDRQTRRTVIRVVSKKTGETISQLPPEYVLRLADELKSGAK
jgi:uncharacterized FlaG/YvyC family protein